MTCKALPHILLLALVASTPAHGQTPPSIDDQTSSGLEDIEALAGLERDMLEDLRLELPGEPNRWGYDGLEDAEHSLGIRTVVEIPAAGDSGWLEPTPSPPVWEAPPVETIETVAHPLTDFDLTGIEPFFGLETLDHPQIHTYLEFWTTRARSRMARLLARSGRYRAYVLSELERQGMPPELLYVVMIESGFNPVARSRAGAVGLWQFMPRTGRGYGLQIDRRLDERNDFEASTAAAITYLSSLHDRFGSWPLALASYNAGGGHVRGELRRYNVTNFWVMDDYSAVYDDARGYVYKIIAAAIIGEHPDRFGFEGVVFEEPTPFDQVEVPGNTQLRVFARAADTDVDTLRELNPALLVAMTPRVDTWQLRIPAGSLASFVEEYDDLDADDLEAGAIHTVRVGEKLSHIAAIYGLPERTLRLANGLGRRQSPPYGDDIVVPLTPDQAATALEAYVPVPEDADEDSGAVVIVPALRFEYPELRRVFYEVQGGDELAQIAGALGVSVFDLAMWNDVDASAALHDDMVLQAYVQPDADLASIRHLEEGGFQVLALDSPEFRAWDDAQSERRQTRRRTYTVRRGDTVGRIARRFGVSSSDIVRWNDLRSANAIRIGQNLRIR